MPRSPDRPPAGAGTSSRSGFTLVELLVAMTLAALIGGAVISLLVRQNEFYALHGEAVYAEQTVRAAGDLVAAELRSAGPADLIAATPDSVSVRHAAWWAVMCTHDPSLNWGTVYVFDTATSANLRGTMGYAATVPEDSAWIYDDGWSPSSIEIGGLAKSACAGLGAPDVSAAWRYRRLSGLNSSTFAPVLGQGALIRKYGRLTFRFDPSSFGAGTALWRNRQELVAPFDTGAVFSYVLANGDTVSSPGTLADVRGIRITATAIGQEDGRVEATRTLDFTVWLRNEQ